ncbi:JmjC domain-containing protein [Burkholderia cenocepacia]|uniref:JmjC domain-containing protein n=1 Tax=Burkholderia cenocepacia TaxID=95486 RepID=UPI002AB258ED|nr:cupin domain-containing protein [Burkholderia cenocepacia]
MEAISKYVFDPISALNFSQDILGRQHRVYRATSDLWKELSLLKTEEYLNQCEGSLHTFTRVLEDGVDLNIPTAARFTQETQKSFIDRAYARGATIKIEDYDTRVAVVAALCRELEFLLGGNVYAMSFLTPAGRRGFPIHFDVADALIIQLEGSKHWKIYEKIVESPTHALNYRMYKESEPTPIDEFVLNKGDVLYIPSGVPHSALCTSEHSLHLSVGLNVWKPLQLINFAVSHLSEQMVSLRVPLYRNDERNAVKIYEAVQEFCRSLKDLDPNKLLDAFETSFNANRPDTGNCGLTNYSQAHLVAKDSEVRRNRLRFVKWNKVGDKIRLFPSSTIRPGKSLLPTSAFVEIPAVAESEICALLASDDPIKISEIPGLLDVPSKISLVQQLLRHGLIVLHAQ